MKNFKRFSNPITSELTISQYERAYEGYRKKHAHADHEFKEERRSLHTFDTNKIKKYVARYLKEVGNQELNFRTAHYNTLRKRLDLLLKKRITTPAEFLNYYETIAAGTTGFYSSGLLRGKTIFAKKFRTILSIIKLVQKHKNEKPKVIFSKALPLVKATSRFGVNALTEIMNTYGPTKFSVTNGRTLHSLADLGFAEFPAANNFTEDTYEKYNNLISELASVCNFKNLGQVDFFLSWYYGKYLRN